MRLHTVLALAVVLLAPLGGCMFEQLSPMRRLTDQVYALNDETRWARIDLATQRVSPTYREAFLSSHRAWGQDVAIADADLTNVTITEDDEHAVSLVSVTWYDQRSLDVRSSTLRQHWVSTDQGFLLEREEIVGGDPRLLDLPTPDDPGSPDAAEEPAATAGGEGPIARR